jgi:hypothetical protein
MLERNELVKLMKATAKADRSAPVAYSFNGENLTYEALNETLRKELNELAGTFPLYRENKNTIFSIIEETMDDILPKKVEEEYMKFAEVKTIAQGNSTMFWRKHDRQRAKQFITKVGLAGIYEVFKLGKDTPIEVQTSAIGGAAQIGLEEFLDGRADFAEVTQIVMEGIEELIQWEVGAALKEGLTQLPALNTVRVNGFDQKAFDRLLAISASYGTPTIYCTEEFAATILPEDDNGTYVRWSDNMKDTLWNNGRFASYRNHVINILPQGFTDATHTTKVIDPGYCYILPGNVKPVKIVMEGQTIVDEYTNKDRSREIQVYKKVGVGVVMTPDICMYVNTDLVGQYGVYKEDKATFTVATVPANGNPNALGLYELTENGYVLTADTEAGENKTYYSRGYSA